MQIFQDDIVKTRILVNEINEKLTNKIKELEDRIVLLEEKIKGLEK
jgi:hypothetical protein